MPIYINSRNTAPTLYQSKLFSLYSKRLIHGFTGKPLSFGGPDTAHNIRELVLVNRHNLITALGIDKLEWNIPNQVHGKRIGETGDINFEQTDGIILTKPNNPVMLLFADCVPVIFYDPMLHVGAVIHAGWRGTEQKITQEAVNKLKNNFGSKPSEIIAAIGPAIGLCCFQISLEVVQKIADSMELTVNEMEKKGFIYWDEAFPDNPRLDLKGINYEQLTRSGIKKIDVLPYCTKCLEDKFFSFRRKEDGRNSAFMILL